MTRQTVHTLLNISIATVWLINGLFCKALNLVPRHKQIVAAILGTEHAALLTKTIGITETIMALWIVSRFKSKLNALVQIAVIAIMNTIEYFLVPDMLLWGRWNAAFACTFIIIIYYNEFILNPKPKNTQ